MKESIYESVIANLERQLELQIMLQAETGRLRTCILKRELSEMGTITHCIDEIAGKMEDLEFERVTSITRSEAGSDAARSFDQLVRLCPEQLREKLGSVRSKLKSSAKETFRMNAANRIMLEEALSSVKQTVSILTRSERSSTGYDFNGKSSVINHRKLLNRIG